MNRALSGSLLMCLSATTLAAPPVDAVAQDVVALAANGGNDVEAAPAPVEPPSCCTLPAGTVVDLEIVDALNSSRHRRGDRFPIRVTVPVLVDGQMLVPAGTVGIGEVVHAAAARGGGAAGELLIAARSLDVDGRTVPLRGLTLSRTGQSNAALALGTSVAIGPFAMFIRGREIEIPASTEVQAKVTAEVRLPPASSTASVTPNPPSES
jgi:hypothetical protein